MMKMVSGDDLPLRQGAGMGYRLFFMATKACGGGTSDLGLFLMVSLFIGFFGVGLILRWASGDPLPTSWRALVTSGQQAPL